MPDPVNPFALLAARASNNPAYFELLKTVLGARPLVFAATRSMYVRLNYLLYHRPLKMEFYINVLAALRSDIQVQKQINAPYTTNHYRTKLWELITNFLNSYDFFTDFKSSFPTTRQFIQHLVSDVPPVDGMRRALPLEELFSNLTLTKTDLDTYRRYHLRECVTKLEIALCERGIDRPDMSHDDLLAFVTKFGQEMEEHTATEGAEIEGLWTQIIKTTKETEKAFEEERASWWKRTSLADRRIAGFPDEYMLFELITANVPVDTRDQDTGDLLIGNAASRRNSLAVDYLLAGGMSVGDVSISHDGVAQRRDSISQLAQSSSNSSLRTVVAKHKQKEMEEPLDPIVTSYAIYCEQGLFTKLQFQVDVGNTLDAYAKANPDTTAGQRGEWWRAIYNLFCNNNYLRQRLIDSKAIRDRHNIAVLAQADRDLATEIRTRFDQAAHQQQFGVWGHRGSRLFGPLMECVRRYETDLNYGFHDDVVAAPALVLVPPGGRASTAP